MCGDRVILCFIPVYHFKCSVDLSQSDVNSYSLAGIREIYLTCLYSFHIYMFCLVSSLISYYPESRYAGVHLCLFFPLCVFFLYPFSKSFCLFPYQQSVLEIPTGPPVRGRQLWRRTGNFLLIFLQFYVYNL